MDTQFDFEEFEDYDGMGFVKGIVAVVAVLVILGVILKKKRNTAPERSIDKVKHKIQSSDMPERTRKSVITALDETKAGITHLRESAEKVAKRAS